MARSGLCVKIIKTLHIVVTCKWKDFRNKGPSIKGNKEGLDFELIRNYNRTIKAE